MSRVTLEWTVHDDDGKVQVRHERYAGVISVAPFGTLGVVIMQKENGRVGSKIIMNYFDLQAIYVEEEDEVEVDGNKISTDIRLPS